MEDNKELIKYLLEALKQELPKDGYRVLRFVLNRLVDIRLRNIPIQFSGLFAKTNYILTEHKAPKHLIRTVENARQRIRHFDELDNSELSRYFLYDLKSITSLFLLIYPDAEIPEVLTKAMPTGYLEGSIWKSAATNYLRVIVENWTDTIITARADAGDSPELQISYGKDNKYLKNDYSYLTPLLSTGTQLNIIRPRQEKGITYPELIIFEPDFLIDISNIAAGFKEYGITPLTALIKKLSPSIQTSATLLGEFASQLLDEELHGLADREYKESIEEFCKHHSLQLATCQGLNADFHNEAKQQKQHIHRAISKELPATVKAFDPSEIILEPSFTSEMLGIQGRMDFLQSDYTLLIEQKSGKAGFVPGVQGFISPVITTPHFVQLLLYRALIHYNFSIDNEQIQPFLLYSKYEYSLLRTASAPELLHTAFRLRNQLVWHELHYSSDGFSILNTLKASDLNEECITNKLWTNYEAPAIESILRQFQNASPLEKAYQQTMLKFVQREYVLSKIGNKRKENSGFSARWHDSLEEKREAGNIIDGIKIEATSTHITCTEMDMGASNFRVGDIVTLYSYKNGTEPDCRKTIIHRASIEAIEPEKMTLKLRVPQSNIKCFDTLPDYSWAIEHDFMDSAFGSQFRGVQSFLSASQHRRDLILSQCAPEVDKAIKLKGNYNSFNNLSLRVKQAKELFLIIGPPGTGKTSFGMLNTLKEELLEPESSVAVMAFTNRSVDEICSKLVAEGIDFIRIGNELSCGEEYRPYLLSNKAAGIVKINDIRTFIRNQKIVVGTTTAFNSQQAIFSLRRFSLAIIDEASQILEPQLLGLMSAKCGSEEAITKFVLIGDHKQLPAVVQQTTEESHVKEPLLKEIGLTDCRLSLFERLLHKYRNNPEVVYMLHYQGRMHEDIAVFPNDNFYRGELSCVPLPHQQEPSNEARVRFIDVPCPDDSPSDKINQSEAEVIAQIVSQTDPAMSIGIIVPYRNQIAAIRNAIHIRHAADRDITIDTVERFQGSQREVIIYGFTVQRLYQLDFLTDNCFIEDGTIIDRKLNVVMTRAMKLLTLVGNSKLLMTNNIFKKLIQQYISR